MANTIHADAVKEIFLPCPFCGELPNVFEVPDNRYGVNAMGWVVECKSMGCMFSRSRPDQSFHHLAVSWNTRYIPSGV